MSTTYSIVCDDCKVAYWSGQGTVPKFYNPELVCKFLCDHIGHHIRHINDYSMDDETEQYEEVLCD